MGSTFLKRCMFTLAAAACFLPSADVRADGDRRERGQRAERAEREVICYVDDDAAAIEGCRDEMNLQFGVRAETSLRRVRVREGASGEGRVALLFRLAAGTDLTTSDAVARMNRVNARSKVRDVVANRHSRARGAPLSIPVLDGDLEPRSVREQFAVAQCSLNVAQQNASGAGVVVAVLDGGFDLAHPHLAGKLHAAKWDTLDDDGDPSDAGNNTDDDDDGITDSIVGHGTFVSSVVLAAAPNAQILALRCLDDEGYGSQLAVAQAIQRAIDAGADVINMSLTIPASSDVVRDAISNALEAGIPIIVASGNEAQWEFDPRISGRIVAVGAVDSQDVRAGFSASSSRVAVYAPGVAVIGAVGGKVPGSYGRWSGTSFSTPWVAGAMALARQVAAGESPRELRQDVVRTADDAYDVSNDRGRLAADVFLSRAAGN